MWSRARTQFWELVTRQVGDAEGDSDRLMRGLETVQQLRVWAEELQSVLLHLAALPTRQDVRRLHRRVLVLRRQVAELDRALAGLEAQAPLTPPAEQAPGSSRATPRPPSR